MLRRQASGTVPEQRQDEQPTNRREQRRADRQQYGVSRRACKVNGKLLTSEQAESGSVP